VEAPRAGDRACTLQHGYENFEKGAVFVRRHGQTVRPDQLEVASLEDRFASKQEPEVGLIVQRRDEPSRELKLLAIDTAAREAWVAEEERHLLASLPQPKPSSPMDIYTGTDFLSRSNSLSGDRRSKDRFREQVSTYMDRAALRWAVLLYQASFTREDNAVLLSLKNNTPENYADVRIVVTLPADLTGFASLADVEGEYDPPERPLMYGDDTITGLIEDAPWLHPLEVPDRAAPEVEADRSLEPNQLVFSVPIVRPKYEIKLPLAFVLDSAQESLGQVRQFSWSLTTRSHAGDANGVIRYRIADNPINLASTVAHLQAVEDEF
jgi:hypothetical protein